MNTIVQSPVIYIPRGMRGLGQADDWQEGGTYVPPGETTNYYPSSGYNTVPWTELPTAGSGGAYPNSAGSGFNWGSFLNTIVGQAGSTARAAITPLSVLPAGSSYYQTASGTAVTTGGGVAPASMASLFGSSSSLLPILLLGGGILLVFAMSKKS